jgi:hypothetical protein
MASVGIAARPDDARRCLGALPPVPRQMSGYSGFDAMYELRSAEPVGAPASDWMPVAAGLDFAAVVRTIAVALSAGRAWKAWTVSLGAFPDRKLDADAQL